MAPSQQESGSEQGSGVAASGFERMWADLAGIGRDRTSGGYRRFAWTHEDLLLREWFAAMAVERGLDLTADRNGNQYAWWGEPDAAGPGLVIGSHLDSVPDGGAFDGPLGVVSAFAAIDVLRERQWQPHRPIAVAQFGDEEGARFGIACAGSRLLSGALDPDRARGLRDAAGVSMAEAMVTAGHDIDHLGRDEEALRRIGAFVELHVEQGRGLVDLGRPVAVGTGIWPHGRFRVVLPGRADHAGTTRIEDRDDPMLRLAALIHEARSAAVRHGCVATVGKVEVLPGAVNAIPSQVTAWLDTRGHDEAAVRRVLDDVQSFVDAGKGSLEQESWTETTTFASSLTQRLSDVLTGAGEPPPLLSTGAGHDAGILGGAGIETGMIFVRNPTGTSHAPDEFAERDDCLRGVDALVDVIVDLAGADG